MTDNNERDIIGFCSCLCEKRGRTIYGCRGIGKTYDEFYNRFLVGKSYVCAYDDFPWDYFFFENEKDEKEFLSIYGNLVYAD